MSKLRPSQEWRIESSNNGSNKSVMGKNYNNFLPRVVYIGKSDKSITIMKAYWAHRKKMFSSINANISRIYANISSNNANIPQINANIWKNNANISRNISNF